MRITVLMAAFISLPFGSSAQVDTGTKAPELSLEGIYHNEGEIPTLASLRGDIVVLDFWATWCSPCVAAFPEYNVLSQKYSAEGVQFIAITDDPSEKLENFLSTVEVAFWVGRDDDKQDFKNYKVRSRPQMYIINREGRIVWEGHSVNENLLEEVIATNTIAAAKPAEQPQKVITNGGFSGGDDPLYHGMRRMLGQDLKERPRRIEHFIIRPSLEQSLGGYGFATQPGGRVGITFSGGNLTEIYRFLYDLPSGLWIENQTGDTSRYDIIYWKKTDGPEAARAEIQNSLSRGLSLQVDTVEREQQVHLLIPKTGAENLKKPDDIKPGAENAYIPLSAFIQQLESKHGEFYLTDAEDLKVHNQGMGWKELHTASAEEIRQFLRKRGIHIKQETRKLSLYELHTSKG